MLGVGVYDYIDNLYVKALVNYGVVFVFVYLAGMTCVMWRLYWAGKRYLVLALCVIAAFGIIHNVALYLYYDAFLFLIGKLALERPP